MSRRYGSLLNTEPTLGHLKRSTSRRGSVEYRLEGRVETANHASSTPSPLNLEHEHLAGRRSPMPPIATTTAKAESAFAAAARPGRAEANHWKCPQLALSFRALTRHCLKLRQWELYGCQQYRCAASVKVCRALLSQTASAGAGGGSSSGSSLVSDTKPNASAEFEEFLEVTQQACQKHGQEVGCSMFSMRAAYKAPSNCLLDLSCCLLLFVHVPQMPPSHLAPCHNSLATMAKMLRFKLLAGGSDILSSNR